MRLEGSDQLKNPVSSSGIQPATFRLVAQCLNQLRYREDHLQNPGVRGRIQAGGCGCVRMYSGYILLRTEVNAATVNRITNLPVPE
jgi:hypothetical protein